MNNVTRGKALLGFVPTAVLVVLALIVPSAGVASAATAPDSVDDREELVAEAEAAASEAQAEAEAAEDTSSSDGASSAGEGDPAGQDGSDATADSPGETEAPPPTGPEVEVTDDGEIVDNAPTFDDEETDAFGNVIEDDASVAEDAIRIMPLGDSITRGVKSLSNGGYRGPLKNKLTSINDDFIGPREDGNFTDRQHAGFGNNTIDDIRARVLGLKDPEDGELIRGYDPDIILLMIGTNDMQGEGGPIAAAPQRLKSLITEIVADAPSATVLVSSIPPVSNANRNGLTEKYNTAIPGVVDDFDDDVRYVNVGGRLALGDLDDGTHPNAQGYSKIADGWAVAITGSSQPPTTDPAPRPCPEGKTRNSKGKCVTTSTSPTSSTSSTSSTSTTRPTTGTCPDGKKPGGKTGQCAGGVAPAGGASTGESPVTTTPSDPVACADGKKPNPKSGKCPGGVEPTLIAATTPPSARCADGKLPNPKVGKCA